MGPSSSTSRYCLIVVVTFIFRLVSKFKMLDDWLSIFLILRGEESRLAFFIFFFAFTVMFQIQAPGNSLKLRYDDIF